MIDVISSPIRFTDETMIVHELFNEGVDLYHLRKPTWTSDQIEDWLNDFGSEFRSKIVLHNHLDLANKYQISKVHYSKLPKGMKNVFSTSTHSIDELEKKGKEVQQAFLSPVFDSISKKGYSGKLFDVSNIKIDTIKVALGGIDKNNIKKAFDLGFDKVALLGAIWNDNPLKSFKEVYNVVR